MTAGTVAGAGLGLAAGAAIAGRRPWYAESEAPRAIHVDTDPVDDIPAEADVVVIGGGISGITTALYLNEFGLDTVVFEKGFIGGEASSRNFGWVYSNALSQNKLPLAELSKKEWFGYSDRFGFDVTARQTGNLTLISNQEELDHWRTWLRDAKARLPEAIDARILDSAQLDELIPGASRTFVAGLHQPSDGTAEPTHAVPRIAEGARREGVKIFARSAVRGLETAGGAIHSVVTEHGEVRTRRVVVAGGAWSRYFLGNLGIDLPQQNIASSMLRIKGGEALQGAGMGGEAVWREELDGSYSIGALSHTVPVTLDSFRVLPAFAASLGELLKDPFNIPLKLGIGADLVQSLGSRRRWSNDELTEFERVRMLTVRHNAESHEVPLRANRELFPGLRNARVVERWGGIMDATPDYASVISEIADIPGLAINSGHGGQGFSFGPGTGLLAAQIVAGKPTSIDVDKFRFSRFHDGTKLEITELI